MPKHLCVVHKPARLLEVNCFMATPEGHPQHTEIQLHVLHGLRGTRQSQAAACATVSDLHGTQVEVDAVPLASAIDDVDAKIAAGATDDGDL